MTGTAVWSDVRLPPVEISLRVDGIATISGELAPGASFVNGRITGTMVFTDSSGAASTCPMVLWTLQPLR
jgi:hypothetical protein